ncbi:DUF2314 domain-containing protein [Pseudomonas cremoricolorata]|uniref:DUF2314 domain-containing protein n=1 Tax=Pseudomonas cremoricolorata TaxID=157783 RepID=UPI0004179078|nr:DUF2314 domain-containing protein [Pseudomonas cremoricolorata]
MSDQPIFSAEGDSLAMQTAAANAQATFKFFWRELSWEARRIVPALEVAAVKMAFLVDSDDPRAPSVENMWLNDVDFDGVSISGVLLNEPQWVRGVSQSERVTLPFGQLDDWLYVSQDQVYGGFTIDAMRSDMADAERAEHDAAWGLEFGAPGVVQLVPASPAQALGRDLDSAADRQTLQALEAGDHPMALNMQEKVEEGLRQFPQMLTDADDAGWLLLHREALAGNYPVLRQLLLHGADASARTAAGHTPAQLAEIGGWQRVAQLLRGET